MNFAATNPWTSPLAASVLDLAAKATVLLIPALAAVRALGGRRPVIGSAAGHACVAGLLLLPLSALALPPLSVACLPALDARPAQLAAPSPEPTPAAPEPTASLPDPRPVAEVVDTRAAGPSLAPARVAETSRPAPPASPPRRGAPEAARTLDWGMAAVAAYSAGLVALLARLAASLLAVRRLRRSGVAVEAAEWVEALARWKDRLGIGRPVALAWSGRVGVPAVVGWLRPTILLPAGLLERDPCGHADAVVLHELAHVRRGDYAWNLLLRLAQAVYWPHPLAWALGRAVAEVRERACDDVCVHRLGGASGYREALLALAEGLARRSGPALGLAMVRPSRLGRRLAGLGRSRGPARCLPRWPVRVALAVAVFATVALLGPARLTRAEARDSATVAGPDEPAKAAGRVFRLRVVAAESGAPVPGADVRVWSGPGDDWRKADEQGRLDLTYATGPRDRSVSVDVWGEGRAMQRHAWADLPGRPIPDGETIRLQPGEALAGAVQDEQGWPIAGAAVFLWSHNYKKRDRHELLYDLRALTGPDGRWRTSGAPETTGELLGFKVAHPDYLSTRGYTDKEIVPRIADLRAGTAVTILKKGVPIEGRVVGADGRPVAGALVLSTRRKDDVFNAIDEFAVTTGDDGRFRTWQVDPGVWFLLARAPGHAPGEGQVRIGTAVPQVEIALGRPHTLKGRVVDADGRPLEGVFVGIDNWRGYRCLGSSVYTDADGCFRWDDAPDDRLLINVYGRGYLTRLREPATASGEELVFALRPALSIHGRVRDAETGQRIERAEVEFGAVEPGTGEVAHWSSLARAMAVSQGVLSASIPAEAGAYKLRIRAEGFAPFVSRAFRREESTVNDYDVALVPGRPEGPFATALRPDGAPLVGARVYSTQRGEGLSVRDGTVDRRSRAGSGREVRTGPDGLFPLPTFDKPSMVLILGEDCYGYASRRDLDADPIVRTWPYARIEGRYLVGTRAVGNRTLELFGLIQDESTMFCILSFHATTTTDGDGRFAFERVIPMPHSRVARRDRSEAPGWARSIGEVVAVTPGETARVTIGGKGRPVVGRVEVPEGWTAPVDFTDRSGASVESNRPYHPYPLALFRGKTTPQATEWFEWSQAWRRSREGIAYEDSRVALSVGLSADGSFRIDDLPAGEYRLAVRLNEDEVGRQRGPFARLVREFTVPPMPGGRSDEPLDLGALRLGRRTVPKAGEPAPPFEVTTVEGMKRALADYRGKFLLLDFGVTWDDQSRLQVPRLNEVHAKYGDDERLAILSLVLGPDDEPTRSFVAEKGQPWPQAIVGPLSNPIASAYGIEDLGIPLAILVGPDGRIVARDLRYQEIGGAVAGALGRGGDAAKP